MSWRAINRSMSTSTINRSRHSYPRPANFELGPRQYPARPLLPLSSAPSASDLPALPARREDHFPALPSGWSRNKLVVPAAYPREYPATTGDLVRESQPFRGEVPKGESKEDKGARIWKEAQELIGARFDAEEQAEEKKAGGQPEVQEEGLWMAAERWSREASQQDEGVTLVVTHANGFTKESWFPTIKRLIELGPTDSTSTFGDTPLASSTGTSRLIVDDILFLDDIHHGASIDLNAGKIGAVHNWLDGGRDVLAAIEQKLSGKKGKGKGKGKGKVIGVGHSFGANALVQAAHARPDLFHAVFLVEPMCIPLAAPRSALSDPSKWTLVTGALRRRTHWPSLHAASESMKPAAFYAKWHPEVFDLWLSHGLVPLPSSTPSSSDHSHHDHKSHAPVQLATPYWAEAAVFAEPNGRAIGWDKLAELEIPTGFVMAGEPAGILREEISQPMVWRPKQAANERIVGAGHLIVQEKPDELADALWRFIGNVVHPSSESSTGNPKARL